LREPQREVERVELATMRSRYSPEEVFVGRKIALKGLNKQ
jgi:hypothetical protein